MEKNKITKEIQDKKIAWSPNPGSQELFLAASNIVFNGVDENGDEYSDVNEIVYHGSRAIGKTEVVLADFAMGVGVGYGKYHYGVIFRKTVKELRDVINKAERFFIQSGAFKGARLLKGSSPKVVFKDGEELLFMHMFSEKDYDLHHGIEYSWINFEELTLWSNEDVMTKMYSCLRKQDSYNETYKEEIAAGTKPKMIGKMRATTNPYGSGKSWVKKKLIDPCHAGKFYSRKGITCMHIKGHFSENRFIKKSYLNQFKDIRNVEMRKAWLYGDWEAQAGGAFGDLWDYSKFVLEPFMIPKRWYVDKAFDWGTTAPFSTLWFAEADGNEVRIPIGRGEFKTFCPPKGSIIIIGEFYGKDPNETKPNVGLNLSVKDTSNGIKAREQQLVREGVLSSVNVIKQGVADYGMKSNQAGHDVKTAWDLFLDEGIVWKECKKIDRADRVTLLQEYMNNTKNQDPDRPHIYIFDSCKFWIQNIPALQYDPKHPGDIDSSSEDHDYDATLYRLTTKRTTSGYNNSF